MITNQILFNFSRVSYIIKHTFIVFLLIIPCILYGSVDLVVNKICFNGLHRVSLDTVLFNLPLKIGSTITQDIIANSIKILFATGYFEEISISNSDDGIVTITVKERPVINTLKIYGNKSIKSSVIQEILCAKKIKSGELLDNAAIFSVTQELEDIFYSYGKFNSTIKINFVFLDRNRVNVRVIIDEGKTSIISRIDIFGNHNFSQRQLLNQFKSYYQVRWIHKLFNKKYQKQKLLDDLEALRIFYLNHGYAKFHIKDTKIDFTENKENVYFSIFITEGSQYVLQSLKICGNILNYIPEIQEYLHIFSGEIYSDIRIKEIENNLKYILGKYGYIQPNISIEFDFDDDNKTIKLYVYADVGNRFYVREINFEGNNFTKDSVIRREIQQIEHAPINYISVLQDQKRLQRFNYFKTVNARMIFLPDLFNKLDLIYKMEEYNVGSLNASIGIGAESRLNMQISLSQENLFGTGNSISITANKNRYQTYFDVSMMKRYIGIKKNLISGKIFYTNLFNCKTDLSNYNTKNYGITIDYAYPVTDYKTYHVGCDYISHNLNHIVPQIAICRYLNSVGLNPLILMKKNKTSLSKDINFYANDLLLVSKWVFNNLNCTYFPESGTKFNIIGYLTLPGSYNKYYKIIMDNSYYLSINKNLNWVLMSTVYAGYASGLYKNIESPFYDNFYIGGIETIRGFRLNSIGPKAVYYDYIDSDSNNVICLIKKSQDTIGGNAVTFIKNELVIPISLFLDNAEYFNTTRMSLFVDIGTVWDTYWKNTEMTRAAGVLDYSIFGHIRISSGVSLKWISPIGPVVFSYSKSIKKYPGDIEEPFQFSIGKVW